MTCHFVKSIFQDTQIYFEHVLYIVIILQIHIILVCGWKLHYPTDTRLQSENFPHFVKRERLPPRNYCWLSTYLQGVGSRNQALWRWVEDFLQNTFRVYKFLFKFSWQNSLNIRTELLMTQNKSSWADMYIVYFFIIFLSGQWWNDKTRSRFHKIKLLISSKIFNLSVSCEFIQYNRINVYLAKSVKQNTEF